MEKGAVMRVKAVVTVSNGGLHQPEDRGSNFHGRLWFFRRLNPECLKGGKGIMEVKSHLPGASRGE